MNFSKSELKLIRRSGLERKRPSRWVLWSCFSVLAIGEISDVLPAILDPQYPERWHEINGGLVVVIAIFLIVNGVMAEANAKSVIRKLQQQIDGLEDSHEAI